MMKIHDHLVKINQNIPHIAAHFLRKEIFANLQISHKFLKIYLRGIFDFVKP